MHRNYIKSHQNDEKNSIKMLLNSFSSKLITLCNYYFHAFVEIPERFLRKVKCKPFAVAERNRFYGGFHRREFRGKK